MIETVTTIHRQAVNGNIEHIERQDVIHAPLTRAREPAPLLVGLKDAEAARLRQHAIHRRARHALDALDHRELTPHEKNLALAEMRVILRMRFTGLTYDRARQEIRKEDEARLRQGFVGQARCRR